MTPEIARIVLLVFGLLIVINLVLLFISGHQPKNQVERHINREIKKSEKEMGF